MRSFKEIDSLTDRKLDLECAAIDGWIHIENVNTMAVEGIWHGVDPRNPIIGQRFEVPYYTSSLFAIHEAVNRACNTRFKKEYYAETLCSIVLEQEPSVSVEGSYMGWVEQPAEDAFLTYQANARNRALALIWISEKRS